MKSLSSPSEDELEKGLKTAARLVKTFGDRYWPVFERLEQELEKRHSRAARLQRRL